MKASQVVDYPTVRLMSEPSLLNTLVVVTFFHPIWIRWSRMDTILTWVRATLWSAWLGGALGTKTWSSQAKDMLQCVHVTLLALLLHAYRYCIGIWRGDWTTQWPTVFRNRRHQSLELAAKHFTVVRYLAFPQSMVNHNFELRTCVAARSTASIVDTGTDKLIRASVFTVSNTLLTWSLTQSSNYHTLAFGSERGRSVRLIWHLFWWKDGPLAEMTS